MIVTPLGWTSYSYQDQNRHLTKAHSSHSGRRPGTVTRAARVSTHRHSDMIMPLGWAGSSYGKGSERARG